MKHNIPAPETNDLETLIARAFDTVPGPDHLRMQSIRDALNHATTGTRSQKSLNKLPWWTVLLLTGGLATAGWWAGKVWFGGADPDQTTLVEMVEEMQAPIVHEKNTPVVPPEENGRQMYDSPLIYQRESY